MPTPKPIYTAPEHNFAVEWASEIIRGLDGGFVNDGIATEEAFYAPENIQLLVTTPPEPDKSNDALEDYLRCCHPNADDFNDSDSLADLARPLTIAQRKDWVRNAREAMLQVLRVHNDWVKTLPVDPTRRRMPPEDCWVTDSE